jgi:hypothetical protein
MTRIGYAKPLTFLRPRGLRHDHQSPAFAFIHCPLLSFSQLQGLQQALTPWKGVSPSVSSLSAPPSPDVTDRLPHPPASRLQVFTTSWRENVRNDLPVYSTRLALLGFRAFRVLPHIDHRKVSFRSAPAPLPDPSWVPFGESRLSTTSHAGISLRDARSTDSSSPCGDRLHLGLESILEH